MSDFFSDDSMFAVRVWGTDSSHRAMRECFRCGSLVANTDRHYRWHQAVDTGATAALPSDSKETR